MKGILSPSGAGTIHSTPQRLTQQTPLPLWERGGVPGALWADEPGCGPHRPRGSLLPTQRLLPRSSAGRVPPGGGGAGPPRSQRQAPAPVVPAVEIPMKGTMPPAGGSHRRHRRSPPARASLPCLAPTLVPSSSLFSLPIPPTAHSLLRISVSLYLLFRPPLTTHDARRTTFSGGLTTTLYRYIFTMSRLLDDSTNDY